MSDQQGWLSEVRDVVEQTHAEKRDWAREHEEALLRIESLSDDVETALWRLRGFSIRAMQKGVGAYEGLDDFLQFTIVNTHDAATEALACIYSGAGAPATALLRRLYELTNLLVAGAWKPTDLSVAMQQALSRPYTDDRYAALAQQGTIGAVMPSPNLVRELASGDSPEIREFESVLKSFAHGGIASSFYYLTDQQGESHLGRTVEHSAELAKVAKGLATLASGAASQIAERLGFEMTYPTIYPVFRPDVVERRENEAIGDFERAFPYAVDIMWSACVGVGSITSELAEHIGPRKHDMVRRQQIILVDGLTSAWLAIELLWRGRLGACGTVTRRLFELSLEAQAWAQKPSAMAKRFNEGGDETTPAATTLIRLLHGARDSQNQRRTYSSLCSIAHGGAQAIDYVFDGNYPRFRIQPAPSFIHRHHVWLLGTLISGIDALLGAALVFAEGVDEEIARGHGGYMTGFRDSTATIPGLTLVRHEEAQPEQR